MQNRDKRQAALMDNGPKSDCGPDGGTVEPARQDFLIEVGSRRKTVMRAGQVPGSVLNVITTGQTAVPMCQFPLKAKKMEHACFRLCLGQKA